MSTREVQYFRPENGSIAEDAYTASTNWADEDPEWIAQDCAEDYHCKHDGWEAEWPLKLTIISGGTNLGTFEISRESQPVFYAHKVTELAGTDV